MKVLKGSCEKNKGFILLITLLIIAVISLLVLTSMHHVLLYYKASNKQEVFHRNFYQLEDIALQLLNQYTVLNQDCVVRMDFANQIMNDQLNHKGCSLVSGLNQYKYYVEDLGEFPCLVIRKNGIKSATRHHRITVVSIEDESPASLLQIRFISAGRAIPCVTKQEQSMSLGVSSWRYLPSIK